MTVPLGAVGGFALAVAGWAILQFLWQAALLWALAEALLWALRGARPAVRERVAIGALAACLIVFVTTGMRLMLMAIDGGIAALSAGSDLIPSSAFSRLLPWIGAGWFVMAELALLALVRDAVQVARLRRHRVRPLLGPLAEWCPVPLLVSTAVEVPTLTGWRWPAILLPARMVRDLPEGSLRAVIAHELAHVRRCDIAAWTVQLVIRALLFFHPAVHRLLAVIGREREQCCDDLAAASSSPLIYARALARIERLRSLTPGPALAADGAPLLGRIRRLVLPQPGLSRRRTVALSSLAAVLIVGGTIAGVLPLRSGPLLARSRATLTTLRDWRHPGHGPGVGADDHIRLRLVDKRVFRGGLESGP